MSQDSDDEDEHFEDLPDVDANDDNKPINCYKDNKSALDSAVMPSWIHKKNMQGVRTSHCYDPYHRNPLYCNADSECIWELIKLTQHYHPTVALFAKNILKREAISYEGDPLEDFTLIRFLDRFVYRNPKKREKSEKHNKMHRHLESKSRHQMAAGAKAVPVNSEKYLELASEIPVHEKFFHRYFSNRAKKRKVSTEEEIDSDVDDDEFDRYLDDYEKGLDGSDLKFDFAGEFSKSKLSKKATKQKHMDEDLSDDDDDDDIVGDDDDTDMDNELSDEEVGFDDDDGGFMSQFRSADNDESEEDFDEENVAFSDNDEMDLEDSSPSCRKPSKTRKWSHEANPDLVTKTLFSGKKRKSAKCDPTNLYAAAEEFADVIDDNMSSKLPMISSSALSNKDNADVKQLKWEMERDRWMSGKDWKNKKRAKQHQKRNKRMTGFGGRSRGRQDKRSAKFRGKDNKKGKY